MKFPTRIILDSLKEKELVFKDNGHPSGIVSLKDAEEAIQLLEIRLIAYYEETITKRELLKQNIE